MKIVHFFKNLFTPQVYIKKSLFLRNAYSKMYVQFQWRNISTTYM